MQIAVLFILLLVLVVMIRKGARREGGSGGSPARGKPGYPLFRTRRNSRPELNPSFFEQRFAAAAAPEPAHLEPLSASDGAPAIPTVNGYGILRVREAVSDREHLESFFDAGRSARFQGRDVCAPVRCCGSDGMDILFTDDSGACYRLNGDDCHLRLQGMPADAYRYSYDEAKDTLLCAGPHNQRHMVYGVRKMLHTGDTPDGGRETV